MCLKRAMSAAPAVKTNLEKKKHLGEDGTVLGGFLARDTQKRY